LLAVRRLSSLGTIVGENVSIQDLGAQVSAADRTLQRLRKQLATLQAEPQTTEVEQRIASLEAQIAKRQQAREATLRAASLATVTLQLASPAPKRAVVVHHGHGPLHGLGVAFRWLGIGAAYALALGLPFVLLGVAIWLVARAVRRRREDALLSRS
jgi:multidrug efflux pump subunit AcrA (membrane-fusion protein)